MSRLKVADRTYLETVLGMSSGYVLDFTNATFAHFFSGIGVDIYEDMYADYGVSKAHRMRTFWQVGTDQEVSLSLEGIADYIEAKKLAGVGHEVSDEQSAHIREIAHKLMPSTSSPLPSISSAVTTEATVSRNLISIEIHEDIFSHIEPFLRSADYFHAVEESYKIVREKLRDLAGSEKSTDVFNENAQNRKHYEAIFGKLEPDNQAEADFFRGIGYLHLGVQFLRNEKAHTLATFVEPNLAIHYISLASLAYDLITRFISDDTISGIEDLVAAKRASYRSAGAFYRDFEGGKWLDKFALPTPMLNASVRKALKTKWLAGADLTRSWDHSNEFFMMLELVAGEITKAEVDSLLDLPTKDSYGNDQEAGMWPFLEFMQTRHPEKLSPRAISRIAEYASR